MNTHHSGLEANLAPKSLIINADSELSSTIWTEDKIARTLYTSTYLSNDGQIKIIQSKRPINYYNSSNLLVPIDPNLKQFDAHSWSAIDQPQPTYLHDDATFSLTLENKDLITLGKNCKINGETIKTEFEFAGNFTNVFNVIPGVHKEINFHENAVKYNYVLQYPLSGNQSSAVFSEEIEIPAGYKIIRDSEYGKQTEYGWNGDLIVVDKDGNVFSTLHMPVCFDNENNHINGSYKVIEENNKLILEIIIPNSWLNDPARVYPIVIDPLVTGPTTTWVGGNMPSCIMPAYNVDSILVTIPAGITITALNVTASFYADPWTTAVMNQGAMSFSTSCATSQSFVITGPTGTSPGTAYLENFNLFSPLTCCFPESCTSSNFYLRMNLGRTGPGTGCNETYIRYDAASTLWPFRAVVIGKTAESYGGQWVVPQTPICSNTCTLTGIGYVLYGVPPFTFTHPWSTQTITQGQNIGCGNGATNFNFTLNIPNCPSFCDASFTSLSVPPPVITDACGNIVGGLVNELVPIKMAPSVTPVYDTLVCSEQAYTIALTTCGASTVVSWSGNSSSGNSDISGSSVNNSSSITSLGYYASASANGCYSDTILVPIYIQPLPIPNYGFSPDPIVAEVPVTFTDEAQINSGVGVTWEWSFGDGSVSTDQNPTYTYLTPGIYNLCLKVTNDNGCVDSLCQEITVIPAEIAAPNIITANHDGINDLLIFEYIQFYPENELSIFNRWGSLIYQKTGYTNDWDGSVFTEGTYFYILKIPEVDKNYSGFFQLEK